MGEAYYDKIENLQGVLKCTAQLRTSSNKKGTAKSLLYVSKILESLPFRSRCVELLHELFRTLVGWVYRKNLLKVLF